MPIFGAIFAPDLRNRKSRPAESAERLSAKPICCSFFF